MAVDAEAWQKKGAAMPGDLYDGGKITLVCIQPEKYVDTAISIVKNMTGGSGIYVIASRPYDVFAPLLEKHDIDTEKMAFVDCISCIMGIPADFPNVRYLATPMMLELIPVYVDMAMNQYGSNFVILDSISSLEIYNSERALVEFLHFFISRMRQKKMNAVLFVMEENRITRSVGMMCDQVVMA